jgi:hypothetical protein
VRAGGQQFPGQQQGYGPVPRYGHPQQQQLQYLGQPQQYLAPQQQYQQQGYVQGYQQHPGQHMVPGQLPPPYPQPYQQPYAQAGGAPADPSTLAALTQQFSQMGFAGAPGAQYPMSHVLPPYMPINPPGQ